MLSGFLAMNQLKDKSIKLTDIFLLSKHKFRKCYWLHIMTFIISLPISLSSINNGSLLIDVFGAMFNLSLTQSLIPKQNIYFSYNAVTWYLSLDITLVFFLPLVHAILCCLKKNFILLSMIVVILIQLGLVCFTYYSPFEWSLWLIYISPFTRWLDYFVGAAIAIIVYKYDTIRYEF